MKIEIGKTYNKALVTAVDAERIYYRINGCLCYCSVLTFEEKYAKEEKEDFDNK